MTDVTAAPADRGVEGPGHACPACGRPAVYVQSEDRFFHRDGSDNDPCWLALLRGQRDPLGWYGHGTVADDEERRKMRCACGAAMVATRYSNSGTTYIAEACPLLVEHWGPDPHVWRRALPPHQFVCRTKARHAATGCCDHRDVRTYP